ncbi:hypothetical protein RF11_08672 [Thelohanellus kitauei]|uniref:Uncharacterized protein n=1 Tax=Thelohanellus kitauei TaxID=669202 RepID=A0A0C2JS45_THEKT|nr:hypothetical protein RF11_08672 [Thelohanellus kitauei]
MALKKSGSHISNDAEIGSIIIYSCMSLSAFCKLLKTNNSGEYFVNNRHMNEVVEILFNTLLNVSIPNAVPKNDLILSVLVSLVDIFDFLCHFHQVEVLNERIYQIKNSEILIFLSRSATMPLSNSFRPDSPSSQGSSNQKDVLFEISRHSLIVLSRLLPLIKSSDALINVVINAKLVHRLVIMVQKVEDASIVELVCRNMELLARIGLKHFILENQAISCLEKLQGPHYDPIRKTIDQLIGISIKVNLEYLNKEDSFKQEIPDRKQNGFKKDQNGLGVSPCVPWIRESSSGHPKKQLIEISNTPPSEEESLSINTSNIDGDNRFFFCTKTNPDYSMLRDMSSYEKTAEKSQSSEELTHKQYEKENKACNIVRSLSSKNYKNSARCNTNRSYFSKIKDKTQLDPAEHKPRRILTYMSNLFKSKSKLSKTQS